jgi:hypothetical protein
MKNLGRFVNLESCYSLDKFDVVKIIEEDKDNFYYNDAWGRWCYVEKNSPTILYIAPYQRIDLDIVYERADNVEA